MENKQKKIKTKKTKPIPKYRIDFPAKKEYMTLITIILAFILMVGFIVTIALAAIAYKEDTSNKWSEMEKMTAIATAVMSIIGLLFSISVIVKAFIFDKRYVKPVKAIDLTAGFILLFFSIFQIIVLVLLLKDKFSPSTADTLSACIIITVMLLASDIAIAAVNLTGFLINKKHPKKIAIRIKESKPQPTKASKSA